MFLLIDLWENFEIVISQGHKIKIKKALVHQIKVTSHQKYR